MPELSHLEELALTVVIAQRGKAYGVSVHDALREAGASCSLGAIYAALDRLEQGGLVGSALGEPSASRGGRRKRMFQATPTGKAALAKREQVRAHLAALHSRFA